MSTPSIEALLRRSSLFAHLSQAQTAYLAQHASMQSYEADEAIVREGDAVGAFWLIEEGIARVTTQVGEREVELKKLGAGTYFGEVSVLSGKAATATVKAFEGPVRLLAIDREALSELIADEDRVRQMLEGVTLARAKDTIAKVLK